MTKIQCKNEDQVNANRNLLIGVHAMIDVESNVTNMFCGKQSERARTRIICNTRSFLALLFNNCYLSRPISPNLADTFGLHCVC